MSLRFLKVSENQIYVVEQDTRNSTVPLLNDAIIAVSGGAIIVTRLKW